jgi:hypothetical protein
VDISMMATTLSASCVRTVAARLKCQIASGNPAKLSRLLTMETMLTRRRERITCDEEERLKYGYNVTTHFRYSDGRKAEGDGQSCRWNFISC